MNVFCERLKSLRNAAKLNQTELGEKLNCQRTRIADLERGKSTPTIEDITILCKTFNVSSDYLLGLSDIQTTNVELKEVCEYTGLTEDALKVLKHLTKNTEYKDLINFIIPHNNFLYVLLQLFLYVEKMKSAVDSQEIYIKDKNNIKKLLMADNDYEKARYHFFETIEAFKKIVEDCDLYQDKYWENHNEIYTVRKGLSLLELAKQDTFDYTFDDFFDETDD